MNVGLLYTPVSIYQMTRGALVLFVAILSIIFLRRRLHLYQWVSLLIVTGGVAVVGLSGSLTKAHLPTPTLPSGGESLLRGIRYSHLLGVRSASSATAVENGSTVETAQGPTVFIGSLILLNFSTSFFRASSFTRLLLQTHKGVINSWHRFPKGSIFPRSRRVLICSSLIRRLGDTSLQKKNFWRASLPKGSRTRSEIPLEFFTPTQTRLLWNYHGARRHAPSALHGLDETFAQSIHYLILRCRDVGAHVEFVARSSF